MLDRTVEEERGRADDPAAVGHLVSPVLRRAYGQLPVVLAQAEGSFDAPLAGIGGRRLLACPVVPAGGRKTLAGRLASERGRGPLVGPAFEPLRAALARVTADLRRLL